MSNKLILFAAINSFLAVGLGALGAHGLESIIAPDLLEAFDTGVDYHMFHSVSLLGTGLLAFQFPGEKLPWLAGKFFLIGILLFSGSLYVLALTRVTWIGAITPIGGLCFMIAWFYIAFQVYNH